MALGFNRKKGLQLSAEGTNHLKTTNMATDFKTFKSTERNGGIQYLYKADNGYGASIVQHQFSYGGKQGKWELAVLKYSNDTDWEICYDTEITKDVIGYLSEKAVNDLVDQIAALKPHETTAQ